MVCNVLHGEPFHLLFTSWPIMPLFKFLSLLSLCALSACAPHASHHAPTATIEAGVVIGTTTAVPGAASATVVNKFLGVPFAASPTRFAPPTSATPWSKPYNASFYGKTCPQQFSYPEAMRKQIMGLFDNPPPPGGEGEDCLNVNIFVPATPTMNKTVMVWIYGVRSCRLGNKSLTTCLGQSHVWLQCSGDLRWYKLRCESRRHHSGNQLQDECMFNTSSQSTSEPMILTYTRCLAFQARRCSLPTQQIWASWINTSLFNGFKATSMHSEALLTR